MSDQKSKTMPESEYRENCERLQYWLRERELAKSFLEECQYYIDLYRQHINDYETLEHFRLLHVDESVSEDRTGADVRKFAE